MERSVGVLKRWCAKRGNTGKCSRVRDPINCMCFVPVFRTRLARMGGVCGFFEATAK